ncbi:MAG: SHOCT domain-containing protein [Anaerolineales bacterium]|nr:SHOCT domain-containing protein [Anaerolineales bacterium]MDW8447930.1 SHOCT domain-containing protein [Anaerolineales bacterium]
MSVPDDLKKLEDLYSAGALSDDEFGRAKEQILGSTPPHIVPKPLADQNVGHFSLSQIRSEGVDGQPTSNGETAWLPGPDVTDFNGNTLPGDLYFFVGPPPELGSIYCAFSTLKRSQVPMEAKVRLACAVGVAYMIAVIGSAVVWWLEIREIWLICGGWGAFNHRLVKN